MPIGENARYVDPKTFARHLRVNPTAAEFVLWQHLKAGKTGFKFRRQFIFDDRTFVDFCCTSVKVIVELDGEAHLDRLDQDAARQKRLEEAGFLVIRFSNEQVLEKPERVVAAIKYRCESRNQNRY